MDLSKVLTQVYPPRSAMVAAQTDCDMAPLSLGVEFDFRQRGQCVLGALCAHAIIACPAALPSAVRIRVPICHFIGKDIKTGQIIGVFVRFAGQASPLLGSGGCVEQHPNSKGNSQRPAFMHPPDFVALRQVTHTAGRYSGQTARQQRQIAATDTRLLHAAPARHRPAPVVRRHAQTRQECSD